MRFFLFILIFVVTNSVVGQGPLLPPLAPPPPKTFQEDHEYSYPESEGRRNQKVHLFLNDDIREGMLHYEMFSLILDTLAGDFTREKEKIALDVDTGRLLKDDIDKKIKRYKEILEDLKKDIVVIKDKSVEKPYYALSKYDKNFVYFDKFYEFSGKERDVKYPSDILTILGLEQEVCNIFQRISYRVMYEDDWLYDPNTSFDRKEEGLSLIEYKVEKYEGFENGNYVEIEMCYFTIDFFEIRKPFFRNTKITNREDKDSFLMPYDNQSSTKIMFLNHDILQREILTYCKYVKNNTYLDCSETEEDLIKDMYPLSLEQSNRNAAEKRGI